MPPLPAKSGVHGDNTASTGLVPFRYSDRRTELGVQTNGRQEEERASLPAPFRLIVKRI
jgi:hypothetical protein